MTQENSSSSKSCCSSSSSSTTPHVTFAFDVTDSVDFKTDSLDPKESQTDSSNRIRKKKPLVSRNSSLLLSSKNPSSFLVSRNQSPHPPPCLPVNDKDTCDVARDRISSATTSEKQEIESKELANLYSTYTWIPPARDAPLTAQQVCFFESFPVCSRIQF